MTKMTKVPKMPKIGKAKEKALHLSQRRPSGIEKENQSTGQAETAEDEENIGTQISTDLLD
jgi:hypothetical protein